jgi:DNA recombination protein Rad52
MAFTDEQTRQLKAKLNAKHVKTRHSNGAVLHYIEGWHAIAEANRIFGFDGWDRETLSSTCVWSGSSRGEHTIAYTARVRISVRAGEEIVVREGSGTGEARALSPGQAHELALKSAETDATKRALASFGNAFGLALYDREQAGVTNGRQGKSSFGEEPQAGPWVLRSADGKTASTFDAPKDFAKALRGALQDSSSIEELFGIWEQNVGTVRVLHRLYQRHSGAEGVDGIPLVTQLKVCARHLATGSQAADGGGDPAVKRSTLPSPLLATKIDKSVLTISEPKRIRSKEHLRFVAQQPCLICGRMPSHAHHVRYAQPRGLGIKVSDEFTVPLCAIHHSNNHSTGDERGWWWKHNIDPLTVAERLWHQSHPVKQSIPATKSAADLEPQATSEANGGPTS